MNLQNRITIMGLTDTGIVRTKNEDSVAAVEGDGSVLIVQNSIQYERMIG